MKGYISQYKKSSGKNVVEEDIFRLIYRNTLKDCFELIEDGYKDYLVCSEKVILADETAITAGIYGKIETIIKAKTLPFDITPEFFVYSDKIKKGDISPKKARRFDLRILTWNERNEKFSFGVEAKLLAETNYKTKVASYLIREYVEDAGMGKFIKKIYDPFSYNEGLMLGHIMNGNKKNIVKKINNKITNTYSTNEHLEEYNKYYVSSYMEEGKKRNLYHILLDFSSLFN